MNVLLTLAILLLPSYADTKPANLNLASANLSDIVSAVVNLVNSVNKMIVDGDNLIRSPPIHIVTLRPIPNFPDLQRRGDEGSVEKRILVVEFTSANDYKLQVNASAIAEILKQFSKNLTD